MEGNLLKTSTSDRNPRSRTKSLLGVLTATALLAGATLAPASASAMANQDNEAEPVCSLAVQEWLGVCFTQTESDGNGGSSGPTSGPSSGPSSAGDKSAGGRGGAPVGGSSRGNATPGDYHLPQGEPLGHCWPMLSGTAGVDAWLCQVDSDPVSDDKQKRASRRGKRDSDRERSGSRRGGRRGSSRD